jgi:hypothetical protein
MREELSESLWLGWTQEHLKRLSKLNGAWLDEGKRISFYSNLEEPPCQWCRRDFKYSSQSPVVIFGFPADVVRLHIKSPTRLPYFGYVRCE